jgi:hypothetical protein
MQVKERSSDKITEIASLEKALIALGDAGCSSNQAYLIDDTRFGEESYSVLAYNGLLFNPSFEQTIERPETPRELENWLYELFDPFLYKDVGMGIRSAINVHQVTADELKGSYLKDLQKKSPQIAILQLTMLLYLGNKQVEEAEKTLKRYSDSTRRINGTGFCLD